MENKLRVGVIFGGRSGEHEVSLMSARSVLNALDPQRYVVTEIGITHDGAWLAARPGSPASVLAAFEAGEFDALVPAAILPDPSRPGSVRFA